MLLLIKKHTETLIERTKTKPQETLEFKLNEQMEIFSFNPPINLVEEGQWLLRVTDVEATNSVFIIAYENNGFSMTTRGHCNSTSAKKTNDELNNLLELRSENDIDLHADSV